MQTTINSKTYLYKKENSAINVDLYDVRRFNATYESSNLLDDLINNKILDNFNDLIADVWNTFYKVTPIVKSEEELSNKQMMQKQIIERIMSDDVYNKYAVMTAYDETLSTVGALHLGFKILEWINDNIDDEIKQKMSNNIQGEEDKEQIETAVQDLINKLSSEGKVDNESKENTSFSAKMNQSFKKTVELKEGMDSFLGEGKQGSNNGELNPKKVPLKDKLELAKHLQTMPKLKQIMAWAGRLTQIAIKKQKSKKIESNVRGGLVYGNNFEQMVSHELLNYRNPKTRLDFLKRYAEGEILQYELVGEESAGNGSIIVCLDQSVSMERIECQSKAVLLAFLAIARRQKRSLVYIPFSSNIGKVYKFPKGKIAVHDVISIAESFLNSSTNFMFPLLEAERHIKKDYQNADIIFITDGEQSVTDDFTEGFIKLKKEKEFKMLTMIISEKDIKSAKELNKMANTFIPFTDKLLGISANDFAKGINFEGIFEI
ncbi:hypothetical protein ABC382_00500 [Lysinibacillus sp. 1P01SD]|uniref:vWA domain-containing protein n=1 Tax=Lysinibacillus sp. 1P01SD TaxID=3132285 RepID=UPI0039A2AE17